MSGEGRVAIVTGSSRGIGAAVAKRLARDGFAVVINYAGSAGPAEALAAGIEKAGGRAITAQADVSDPSAVARMFGSAEAALGGVDVLVNNAGIMQLSPITDTTDQLFDRQIAINLKGVFNGLREAAKCLRSDGCLDIQPDLMANACPWCGRTSEPTGLLRHVACATTDRACPGKLRRVLTEAMAAGGAEAKRAFDAMMDVKKIDVAAIEAAPHDDAASAVSWAAWSSQVALNLNSRIGQG